MGGVLGKIYLGIGRGALIGVLWGHLELRVGVRHKALKYDYHSLWIYIPLCTLCCRFLLHFFIKQRTLLLVINDFLICTHTTSAGNFSTVTSYATALSGRVSSQGSPTSPIPKPWRARERHRNYWTVCQSATSGPPLPSFTTQSGPMCEPWPRRYARSSARGSLWEKRWNLFRSLTVAQSKHH